MDKMEIVLGTIAFAFLLTLSWLLDANLQYNYGFTTANNRTIDFMARCANAQPNHDLGACYIAWVKGCNG